MARKCENWLHTFIDWTLPRSEAPESFILWGGLFTVSAVLKRHIYFPKALLGSYNIFPNLYVIFVGPPGIVRKSTTTNYSEELFRDLTLAINGKNFPLINIASTATTDSALVEALSQTTDGTMTILSSEFGSFVNPSKERMYDLLTDLFDGKVKHDYSTRLHGVELVKHPNITLLAATTPDWISTQAREHLTGGGFSSRCIFIFENRRRKKQLYYDLDWKELEAIRADLQEDLQTMSQIQGPFSHDSQKTMDAMEDWYQALPTEDLDERVSGYYNRKHVHVHKIAMILSICESDSRQITMSHFEQALKLFDVVEAKMPRTFSSIGHNPLGAEYTKVSDFIASFGDKPVPKSKILSRFWHNLKPAELDEVLEALCVIGEVQRVREAGKSGEKFLTKKKRA